MYRLSEKIFKSPKFILIATALIFICILPAHESIKNRTEKEITLSDTPPKIINLHEGDLIQQTVYIRNNSNLKNLSIWFSTNNESDTSGRLRITLSQNDLIYSTTVNTMALIGNEYYPVTTNLPHFSPGFLNVSILVEQLNNSNSIKLGSTNQAEYGLDPLKLNGIKQTGTLMIKYALSIRDQSYRIIWLLIFLIIITICFAAYLMCCQENKKTGWLLTIISAALIVEILFLLFPAWSYEGVAWAEGATIFYDTATNNSIWNGLATLEGDMYLSTYNSIISLVAVKILNLHKNFFVAVQITGLIFRAMTLAPFCSHYFKGIFNRPIRFVITIIGICYIQYTFSFIGTAYCGVFFLLLLYFYDYQKIHWPIYIIAILMAVIICMSKMFFFVFAPSSIILLLLCRKYFNRKKTVAISIIAIASFMEAFLSILLRKGVTSGNKLGTLQTIQLQNLPAKILYYTIQFFNSVFWHNMNTENQLLINIMSITFLSGLLFFIIYQIIHQKRYVVHCKYMLALLSLIICSCGLELLVTPDFHAAIKWDQVQILQHIERYEIGYISAFTILLLSTYIIFDYFKSIHLLNNIISINECQNVKSIILAIIFAVFLIIINQYPAAKTSSPSIKSNIIVGDWKAYAKMLDKDYFLIKIDPDGWFYNKNSNKLSFNLNARTHSISIDDYKELTTIQDKNKFVFYVKKSSETNQVLDRYYYMTILDANNKPIVHTKQINTNKARSYISFYIENSDVFDIDKIIFTYEDGTPAKIEGTVDIGYR